MLATIQSILPVCCLKTNIRIHKIIILPMFLYNHIIVKRIIKRNFLMRTATSHGHNVIMGELTAERPKYDIKKIWHQFYCLKRYIYALNKHQQNLTHAAPPERKEKWMSYFAFSRFRLSSHVFVFVRKGFGESEFAVSRLIKEQPVAELRIASPLELTYWRQYRSRHSQAGQRIQFSEFHSCDQRARHRQKIWFRCVINRVADYAVQLKVKRVKFSPVLN
jgi:hypothetical protein